MSDFNLTTPVAFLIFNRPDNTALVFEQIRLAKPKKLLIVADGPRKDKVGEEEKCQKCREVIKKIDWECEVLTNFSNENLGCKERIASGITWVFEMVEEAIILEDDCVPNQDFFRFVQTMLERYRYDTRVKMIAGMNHFLDTFECEDDYFFSRWFNIWGWGSWRRAWNEYDLYMVNWPKLRKENQLEYMYSSKAVIKYITEMFNYAYDNKVNTWDIQWFYSCLFNNGLCLVPKVNMISNVGIEGTHTNNNYSSNFLPTFSLREYNRHSEEIYPNYQFDKKIFKEKIMKKSFSTKIKVFLLQFTFISKINNIIKK